ncbi:hypothetical protein TNCV_3938741 [Trichonephila clavipes]|nr:hypothetical protein TNCV_3938741 [Trichonephila clavipes]
MVEVEIEVVSPSIVPSGNFAELNRTVTCMVLKANDRRTSCPCHDEFRGPRSDYVRQWLATLTVVPWGLSSNPRKGMDICKCIMPVWPGDTLNSCRDTSPFVWLVEGKERSETPDHTAAVLSQNGAVIELNNNITCIELKATANDQRTN